MRDSMTQFKSTQTQTPTVFPIAGSEWSHTVHWEQCERRLAMSAMPWMPWESPIGEYCSALTDSHLGNQASPISDHPIHPSVETAGPQPLNPVPELEQQLSEAHSQTGWSNVQSQYGLHGNGQTVAVIDSGIAFDHMALGHGYGPGYRVVGGWDFAENDARPYDDAPAGFHGTHVAGIIGANDATHQGVAPEVDLVALRVFDDAGRGELSWAESALRWVHQNRFTFENPITTVNLSIGSTWNSNTVPSWGTLEDELLQLQQDGIVVVASAGNAFQQFKSSGLSYPAASPYVIPVGSIDANGQLSDFSQRDSRMIVAPGRQIESTVPDYFYGKDGDPNDWATASGTSMAAPYVVGASVLVREAMEMVGIQNITSQSIYDLLRSTAKNVWDSATSQNYLSLDLEHAINSILPDDSVGDTFSSGQQLTLQSHWQTDGWLNTLSDRDVYRVSPAQDGTLTLDFGSEYLENSTISVLRGSQELVLPLVSGKASVSVRAGESLGFAISDSNEIGSYELDWTFVASSTPTPTPPTPVNPPVIPSLPSVDLGTVDFHEAELSGSSRYRVTADHSGTLTLIVDAESSTSGTLQVRSLAAGSTLNLSDTTIEKNQWRIDMDVVAGQSYEVTLPGSDTRSVQIVNLLQKSNDQLTIYGTEGADAVAFRLDSGLGVTMHGVDYQYSSGVIKSVVADMGQNNDSVSFVGSSGAERAEFRPSDLTVENTDVRIQIVGAESARFDGTGGPDRVYMYDAATDDRLNIWPNRAQLTGVGYAFDIVRADRIFVHAVQGGDDQAFVFDSANNDTLSVRPQFTSMTGSGFFSYVAGFERVFAYSSAGGTDSALLYDSAGDDLFSTSGEVTSIVGPGFSTFARGFEQVEGIASAGGNDKATIYAPAGGQLTAGADYVGMQGTDRVSIARTFERIETYVGGNVAPTPTFMRQSVELSSMDLQSSDSQPTTDSDSTTTATTAAPMIAASSLPGATDQSLVLEGDVGDRNKTSGSSSDQADSSEWLSLMLAQEIEKQFPSLGLSNNFDAAASNREVPMIALDEERELLNLLFATYGDDV